MRTADELDGILQNAAQQVTRLPTSEVFKVFAVVVGSTLVSMLKQMEERNQLLRNHVEKTKSPPPIEDDLEDFFNEGMSGE